MYYKIPCTYLRGGTSRALFFHKRNLPEDQSLWPELFKKALGVRRTAAGLSAMGQDFPTHKVAVISPHEGPDADVDYNFFQVDGENDYVDNRGNCGNMSSAVGPFAVNEGLVPAVEPETVVRIYNTNTRRVIVSRVQVKDGVSCEEGDAVIHGAPGSAAPVWLTFENPGGGLTDKLFPTGNRTDVFELEGFGPLPVTLIDCANPVVLFRAEDVGLTGTELTSLNSKKEFIPLVRQVRGMAAKAFGLVERWEEADTSSTYIPFVGIVSKPQDYADMGGNPVKKEDMDLCCRSFVTKLHRAYPIAAAIATAAAARIPGTVAYDLARPQKDGGSHGVILGHAGGCTEVQVEVEGDHVVRGTVLRTANTIFKGVLRVEM